MRGYVGLRAPGLLLLLLMVLMVLIVAVCRDAASGGRAVGGRG